MDLEPTCTQEGRKSLHCLIEGHEDERFEEEVIPALGHDWNTTPTIQWAADGKSGVAVYHCNRDASHTRNVNFTASGNRKSAPTCIQNGTTTYTANIYDEITDSNYTCSIDKNDISPLGHNFTREVANTQFLKSTATCTVPETYYKSCSRCGISSKGHNNTSFTNGVMARHMIKNYAWYWCDGDVERDSDGRFYYIKASKRNLSDYNTASALETPFNFPNSQDKNFWSLCEKVQPNHMTKNGKTFERNNKHGYYTSNYIIACECINCFLWGENGILKIYDTDMVSCATSFSADENLYSIIYKNNDIIKPKNNNDLRKGINRTFKQKNEYEHTITIPYINPTGNQYNALKVKYEVMQEKGNTKSFKMNYKYPYEENKINSSNKDSFGDYRLKWNDLYEETYGSLRNCGEYWLYK